MATTTPMTSSQSRDGFASILEPTTAGVLQLFDWMIETRSYQQALPSAYICALTAKTDQYLVPEIHSLLYSATVEALEQALDYDAENGTRATGRRNSMWFNGTR